jgi:hypothetical protein
MLVCALALACGPMEAPRGVVDLRRDPGALASAFDAGLGVPRLVLLLSPA